MSRVLVLAEHRKGALREVSFEALSAARLLPGAEVTAVVMGKGVEALAGEVARHAPRVLHVDDDNHASYEPAVWTTTLAGLVSREKIDAVLLPHSYHGMDLAGRLAATLDWPLATDVTALEESEGRVVAQRMVYGGRVAARVAMPAGQPFIVSVRPTAFEPAALLDQAGQVEQVAPGAETVGAGVRFVEYVEEAAGDVDISQAMVIVSVGRGIGEEENLEMVSELAEALGGALACSRPVVDRGWLPRSRQVGTSGKTIRPKVYLAVGISGAFQHVAGMKGAGRIIAINKDSHAPIFKVADYGIVGDLHNIIPAVTQAARERK